MDQLEEHQTSTHKVVSSSLTKGILGPQTSLGASRQLNDEGMNEWMMNEAFFHDFLEKGF